MPSLKNQPTHTSIRSLQINKMAKINANRKYSGGGEEEVTNKLTKEDIAKTTATKGQ